MGGNPNKSYPERNHRSTQLACNPEAIAEVFASKHETLFQGTSTDPVELQYLYRTIKSGVPADEQSYSSVNVNDVLSPFHSGCFGLTSSELAIGATAYRFHSEKLIRSLVN